MYPVSQKWGQFLKLLQDRPVLNLEKLNPKLFDLVDDLKTIQVYKTRKFDPNSKINHVIQGVFLMIVKNLRDG